MVPVSYTHLDNVEITVELIYPVALNVGLRFASREGGRTVGEQLSNQFAVGLAVSYTHLDVYKRQESIFAHNQSDNFGKNAEVAQLIEH